MLHQTTVIKQIGGYCVVQRDVAQFLRKHIEALGLYVFLLSLPDGWEFKKSWLKKETGIGINKLNRLLSFLADHNLIRTTQRKVKGKFAEFEMEVFDGKDFKPGKQEPLFKSPYHRFRATETVATEMEHKILEKEITEKEINTSCSSSDERHRDEESFNRFWEAYPRHEGKKAALRSWKKIKQEDHEKIINDVDVRKNNNWKGKDKQYIPLPASYLNQERWNDEIIPLQKGSNNATSQINRTNTIQERIIESENEYLESLGRQIGSTA